MTRGRPGVPDVSSLPPEEGSLPRQLTGLGAPIVWGAILLVIIEGTVLSLFVVSYFYLRLSAPAWPPAGVEPPELLLPGFAQVLLVLSAAPLWLALPALARDRARPLLVALPGGVVLALAYLTLKVREYGGKEYRWDAHAYGSIDWSMTGYAGLHVVAVVLAAGFFWVLGMRGHFGARRYTGVQALLIYWVYVALGSLLFYGVQYVAPHLIGGGGLLAPG